ncbi:MAG: c-type cytochrome [Acidobacteriia bacterium]|nr:c-type cytochrome [Terriglobia bacterium]
MSRGGCRQRAAVALCLSAWLGASACDPPGKPKLEPPGSMDITDFATLYGENCAGCHGEDGRNGPGRILNDPLYLAVMPRDELQKTIENGRPGTAMPPWAMSQGGPLSPKQVSALVDGIEKNWAKPQQFAGATLPPYAAGDEQGDAGRGKKLFLRDCFMCHGQGAKIGPVTDASYLQLSSDQLLRTSIIVGRPDLGMPDYRNLNMGRALSNQDIADLVAYLVSVRPPGEAMSAHVLENGAGQNGATTRGNEGSGYGPGSPRKQEHEGVNGKGSSSQGGVK